MPSHLAMWFTGNPPAVVNSPPTYTSVPLIAIASTSLKPPETPPPRLDHAVPFHLAMLLAGTPPAVVKYPPTYTSFPLTAIALTPLTWPMTPSPSEDHEV